MSEGREFLLGQSSGRCSADAERTAGLDAQPSGAGRFDTAAMQHAVNVFADVIETLNLTAREAEVAKAVIRAAIRKLNAGTGGMP